MLYTTFNIFSSRLYSKNNQSDKLSPCTNEETKEPSAHNRASPLYEGQTHADIFTDASVSPYGGVACIGWLKKETLENVKFELLKPPSIAVNLLEAKAIVRAILKNNSIDCLNIFSDSQAGIKIVNTAISGEDYHASANFFGSLTVEALTQIDKTNDVHLLWVKAHQENVWNILCDQLVRYGRNTLKLGASITEVNYEANLVLREMMKVRGLE